MTNKNQTIVKLSPWSGELIAAYESGAANQFILYGNVNDKFMIPGGRKDPVFLPEFMQEVLFSKFDVVLNYDLGLGIRAEKGEKIFSEWPTIKEKGKLSRVPGDAISSLTHYFRYTANLAKLSGKQVHVACVIRDAELVAPAVQGNAGYDINSLAVMMRDWSREMLLVNHTLAVFLITENLNDLHGLLVKNNGAFQVKLPLPDKEELETALNVFQKEYPVALEYFKDNMHHLAGQMSGTTLNAIEARLKTSEYKKEALKPGNLVALKKQLVEKDCNGLIEFIESDRSLDDFFGHERIKTWLKQDIALWQKGDLEAMPKGYLFCGPVGTGKTFLLECLAGSAGVPVVELKNFRDKWVGSTEGNLEKIFRLLQGLGRCIVFIDEADQALGKRGGGDSSGSGLSGRIYSMIAEEMSNSENRGKIIWALASSRPDLIEVDLKRPGRIDVKIPIFPAVNIEERLQMLLCLCGKRGIGFEETDYETIKKYLPAMLTAGDAESIAVKIYRLCKVESLSSIDALVSCLDAYQSPIAKEILDFQIGLAVKEASDMDFVPKEFW